MGGGGVIGRRGGGCGSEVCISYSREAQKHLPVLDELLVAAL